MNGDHEWSNSSWAEMESLVIGHFPIYPLTTTAQQVNQDLLFLGDCPHALQINHFNRSLILWPEKVARTTTTIIFILTLFNLFSRYLSSGSLLRWESIRNSLHTFLSRRFWSFWWDSSTWDEQIMRGKSSLTSLQNTVQAALVIRGFGIRGFDYSRAQKPRITRENCTF